ncbi:probable galacturonosyltransferase 6 isoform X2 [Hibiscus syriacus]|uniref:probable galacturonosyltransferase 6 isoform X2 n=1 Tax=Hibiscus syriacus TaxID=106335 RepID=UPI001920BC29|nr:probable galacturonosyltransferase 6 isoform X2 [Hibiscus syriacus]
MKKHRRWLRIVILSLLSFSVLAPIMLVSLGLKTLTSIGKREFIEDLASIKHRADNLRFNAVEQESAEELKGPKLVFKEKDFSSVVSHSSDENHNLYQSGNAPNASKLLETSESEITHEGKDEHQIQQKIKLVNSRKKEQPNQERVKRDQHLHNQERNRHDQHLHNQGRGRRDQYLQSQSHVEVDEKINLMRDQIIRAKAYLNFAPPNSNSHLIKELRTRIKEVEQAVGDACKESDLPRSASQKMKAMEASLSKASRAYPHCSQMATKLRAMAYNAEEQIRAQKNQESYLVQLAGRTTPKGLHCLSMRLTAEYFFLQPEERQFPNQQKLNDPDLYHYAVFSDNILACAVVVNSTISFAKEPEKIVFHVVTDSLNLPAISMWFLLNPPGKATIHIQSIESFDWLATSHSSTSEEQKSNDPRYTSVLNHLRFYLPDIFPALNKIVLFDHDVVVQRDLTEIWSVDMTGKVNAAVETCLEREASYRAMHMFLNLSDPFLQKRFDANACTWAFGMNLFELQEWRRKNLTGLYRAYVQLGLERPLWKAGSLPLGWITFYNQTVALDKRWHTLGLGYNAGLSSSDMEDAAVLHYDGVMKPWLEIGIAKYKGYWSKHLQYDQPYMQQCNINE